MFINILILAVRQFIGLNKDSSIYKQIWNMKKYDVLEIKKIFKVRKMKCKVWGNNSLISLRTEMGVGLLFIS